GRDFADARVERLAKSIDLERLQVARNDPDIERQRAELTNRLSELRARMGDPLIQVDAPIDSERVIAIMPGGEIKPLAYNVESRRWEARFDIPTYAAEGAYEIVVIVIRRA